MAINPRILSGGTNTKKLTAEEVSTTQSWFFSEGIPPVGTLAADGDFAVQAQASPNKTVIVNSGKLIVKATPTGENERYIPVVLSADYNITIADNVTGGTRYDKIYVYLDPATLANPPASGDFTETASLKTQRDTTAGVALTDTNSYLLAEIVVANGFTSITTANITDKRAYSVYDAKSIKDGTITTAKLDAEKKKGWDAVASTLTYQSPTTASGTGLLSYIGKGDKLKATQVIPLTSYFSFDTDNSDAKGNATVTNIGTPTYTAGKFGNALTLNGTDQALAITDGSLFKPTGPFSILLRFKTSSTGSTKYIFQSYSDNTNSNGIRIAIGTGNKLYVGIGNNSADDTTSYSGTTVVTDNNWHYVSVSYQNNFIKVMLDGNLEISGYSVAPTYAATNYVRIGCANDTGTNVNWFNGQIDDLTFINGFALDEQYVKNKYDLDTAQTSADITTTSYFYITAVTDTLLTLTGGADYALYNTTITNPYYSKASSPVGFPANSDTFSPIGVNKATVMAVQPGFGSTETDITGLSFTCTVPSGTRLRLTACAAADCASGNTSHTLRIKDGTTTIKADKRNNVTTGAGSGIDLMAQVTITPTAGSHTYKATLQPSSGGAMLASAEDPAYIMAEIV